MTEQEIRRKWEDALDMLEVTLDGYEKLRRVLEHILDWYGGDPNDLSDWTDCMLMAREAMSALSSTLRGPIKIVEGSQ